MCTRPKCTTPRASSSGFTRSRSPIDTPPDVTSTSAPAASAASRRDAKPPASSAARPRSRLTAPASVAAAPARRGVSVCAGAQTAQGARTGEQHDAVGVTDGAVAQRAHGRGRVDQLVARGQHGDARRGVHSNTRCAAAGEDAQLRSAQSVASTQHAFARRHVAAHGAHVLAGRLGRGHDAHAPLAVATRGRLRRVFHLDHRVRALRQRRARGDVRHRAAGQRRRRRICRRRSAVGDDGELARAVGGVRRVAVLDAGAEGRLRFQRNHVLRQHAAVRLVQRHLRRRQRRHVRQHRRHRLVHAHHAVRRRHCGARRRCHAGCVRCGVCPSADGRDDGLGVGRRVGALLLQTRAHSLPRAFLRRCRLGPAVLVYACVTCWRACAFSESHESSAVLVHNPP